MLRYAIIGSGGFIAPRHVEAISDTGGVVMVTCDIEKKADFSDYREMLASPVMRTVDAIVICTPNYLHPEMIRDCLRAGKRVLCEKPLTINTDFSGLDGVNVVLQLRYHPLFNEICEKMRNGKNINVVMKAYRDEEFWSCWKGDERKSGGVAFILGPHIFDLLMCSLGTNFTVLSSKDSMRKSVGKLSVGGKTVNYHLEFLPTRKGQTRHIDVDGEKLVLSLKDNLSFEGLHDKVHMAFINHVAPTLESVVPSILLMNDIKRLSK